MGAENRGEKMMLLMGTILQMLKVGLTNSQSHHATVGFCKGFTVMLSCLVNPGM